MALKVRYCDDLYLLLGAHEDKLMYENFGFLDECRRRLDDPKMLGASEKHHRYLQKSMNSSSYFRWLVS